MYQVNVGDKILYYPLSDDAQIFDTSLNEEVGLAGEFTFKVAPTNPFYSYVTAGAIITILQNKKEIWRGEIKNINFDFDKIADVYCVEDLAWLGDESVYVSSTTGTNVQMFEFGLSVYNSPRSGERTFAAGHIYNASGTCEWKIEYGWSVLDAIRNCICRDNLYLKVRRVYENGVLKRYIDAVRLEDYGKTTTQTIEYGYNLLDYVKESDSGNLTNVIHPFGAEYEDDVVYDDYSKRYAGNTISDNASIQAYGRREKSVVFDGVTSIAAINSLARAYLTRYSQPQLTMEVKAIDLSEIENVQNISIGDRVRIIAKPYAIDQNLYLTQYVRDLQRPENNTITLGGHVSRKSLTNQVNNFGDTVDEIPSEWDILKAAKRNALKLLLDETQGGYVVFEYDADNTSMVAINICDAKTIEASTKRWRWSQNGLGYMERANINNAWSTLKVAMTNNGSIVADRIDTGTLTAAIIKAGILSDKNGVFSLNMTTGNLIMNGGTFKGSLSAATGSFKGALDAATGTFAGKLSAATGSFSGKVTAKSGYIGTENAGWVIATSNIHNKNGPTNVGNHSRAGTYVGTDGFLNSDGAASSVRKYVQITGGEITANAGSIGGFTIDKSDLKRNDAIVSENIIGCGTAGNGIVNMVGGKTSSPAKYGYIQICNDGDPDECLDGLRIYGNGIVRHYNSSGNENWWFNLQTGEHGTS